MKDIDQLIKIIPSLDVMDFIGLARILRVELVIKNEEDKIITRDFTDVLEDTLCAFKNSSREKRREILRIVKKANANNSKNT